MKHFLRPVVMLGMSAVVAAGGLAARSEAQGIWHGRSLLLLHSQSYLGVDLGDVDQDRAQALHLKDTQGAEITVLDHDAPAGKVGLKLHDVILQVNGQTVANADQMKKLLRAMPAGHKVQLVINRDGAPLNVTVQLADRRKMQEEAKQQIDNGGGYSLPAQGFLSGGGTDVPPSSGFHIWGMGSSLKIGALVEPLSAQMSDYLGVPSGLMIKSVAHKSAANAAGLKPYDVILGVGGENVVTSSDWERLLRAADGKPVQVEILRDRLKQLVLLQVDGKRH